MTSLFDLTGRLALVTGSGKGIGARLAEGLVASAASSSRCSRRPGPPRSW
ncbi:hypothetical protein [Saccharothrix sp. ALI-22-I]|nr:hypothetical protein [Saccharothrix sp. ALI-22-I]